MILEEVEASARMRTATLGAAPSAGLTAAGPCAKGDVLATVGGDIVVVAVFAKDPALSMFHLGEHELRLIGSMMYRHEDYLTAIDYVSKGIVNLKPLISNRFAFEEYDDAYRFIDSHRETSMKVIIDLDQKPQEKK